MTPSEPQSAPRAASTSSQALPVRTAASWPTPSSTPRTHEASEILAALKHHAWHISWTAVASFVLVMTYTALSRMEFTSTAQMYLGELGKRSQTPDGPSIDSSGGNLGDLGSELKLLQSRTLIERAILGSGLNTSVTPAQWSRPGYLNWRLSRRTPDLIDKGYRSLSATQTYLSESQNTSREFKLTFSSDVAYQIEREGRVLGKGELGTSADFGEVVVLLHPGASQGPHAGDTFTMVVSPLWETTELVEKKLDITTAKVLAGVEPTKVVTLEFVNDSPKRAASFLRELLAGYFAERQAWRTEEADAAERFVSSQLETTRLTLDKLQQGLATYRTENKGVILNSEADSLVQQTAKYEEDRVNAQLEVAALTHIERALHDPNAPLETYMVGEPRDPVLVEMASSLASQRNKLLELETRYSAGASEYKQARAQLDAQVNSIRGYVANKAARAQDNLTRISSVIGQFDRKLRAVPAAEFGLAQLTREAEVYNSLYASLLKRQQESAILRASTVSMNRVLDAPEVSYKETAPRLWLRLLSAPFGAVLGIFLVLLRSVTSTRFESATDVERTLSTLPLLTSLPKRKTVRGIPVRDARWFDILATGTDGAYIEAIRILRANLYRALPSRGQILLVTSPAPGDGKTTCTLSLAALLVADGRSALVIHADAQTPHGNASGDTPGSDMRAVLQGALDWRGEVRSTRVAGGEFSSIDLGMLAASELLGGAMQQFLTEARAAYDYVLLDTPSFPTTSDALILAPLVDCVLSVIRPRHTPRQVSVEHARRLQEACPRCALVINEAEGDSANDVNDYATTRASLMAPRFSGFHPANERRSVPRMVWFVALGAIVALVTYLAFLRFTPPLAATPEPAATHNQ